MDLKATDRNSKIYLVLIAICILLNFCLIHSKVQINASHLDTTQLNESVPFFQEDLLSLKSLSHVKEGDHIQAFYQNPMNVVLTVDTVQTSHNFYFSIPFGRYLRTSIKGQGPPAII